MKKSWYINDTKMVLSRTIYLNLEYVLGIAFFKKKKKKVQLSRFCGRLMRAEAYTLYHSVFKAVLLLLLLTFDSVSRNTSRSSLLPSIVCAKSLYAATTLSSLRDQAPDQSNGSRGLRSSGHDPPSIRKSQTQVRGTKVPLHVKVPVTLASQRGSRERQARGCVEDGPNTSLHPFCVPRRGFGRSARH